MAKIRLRAPRTNDEREVKAWERTQNDDNFSSISDEDLDPSRLVDTDANGALDSVADLTDYISGTGNQVEVADDGDGSVTLSTPQDIDTNADAAFSTVSINKVIFSTTAGATVTEGQVCWNDDDGTLNVGLPGGNVVLQVGQELMVPRAKAIGSNIDNGQLVYVSGGTGSNPEMTLAKADALATSKGTLAMATEDIAQNQFGYYTAFGLVRDVDTSSYSPGDLLYLSAATAGDYTDTEPTRPNFSIKVGIVIRDHATEGVIFVNIRERSLICLQQDNAKLLFGDGSDVSMYYDGTDYYILTDEVAASDLKLDCGTDKTLELQETVWEDIQFSVSGGRVPAANAPTFSTFTTNTKEFQFDVGDLLYLDANEYAHAFKTAADWMFHLHVTTDSANSTGSSQYAKFTLYVAYADTGDTWTETSVTAELEIPDGTSTLQAFFLSLGTVSASKNIGTQIKLTITRIAATGGTEYPDEIFLTQVGLHGEVNTMGSRQAGTK